MTPAQPWLRLREAAALAAVSVKTLRRAIVRGDLVAGRAGRVWRLKPAHLDAWMLGHLRGPAR